MSEYVAFTIKCVLYGAMFICVTGIVNNDHFWRCIGGLVVTLSLVATVNWLADTNIDDH